MNAGDIMTLGAATVRVDASVSDAARLMLQFRISGLPVVDAAGTIVGMITEGDLLSREELGTATHRRRWLDILVGPETLAEDYVRSRGRRVEEVMTRPAVTITERTPVTEIVDLMEDKGIKRLPVVRDGKVVGIVSRANLLRRLIRRAEERPTASVDDADIRKHIMDELGRQDWRPSATVDVVVQNGIVELRGTVTEEPVKEAVRVVAENAPGVTRVIDRLEVAPALPGWI
ncbi:CBS domain-containing protein [Microbaculum marinisediminis]|uniref:CBS domain-containing protein n=1 Tax=Microbaculum marinisediminis TaxID=2931392 RepID=A0AAW5QZ18_9HYPH|nr:CBS domain-containing protein [Microbaculum sp. A6E488]MCT8971525.1 CBS domain-containing protein [Microbaculum sp. A6E488]